MKIEGDGVSSAEASARLRVDALTADNLRLRRENAQLREDARRVVNVQRTMETALEQQKRRCEALENRLGEERERANASFAKASELEAAADALRARIKKLETGEEDSEDGGDDPGAQQARELVHEPARRHPGEHAVTIS